MPFEKWITDKIGDDEKVPDISSVPDIGFTLKGHYHQANICVCCDRFITRTSEVRWNSKTNLLINANRLIDVEVLEALNNCYNIVDSTHQQLLLSPRARVNIREQYVCCSQCSDSLCPKLKNTLSPKFSIYN